MTSDYSEFTLVEKPAIFPYAELSWQTANCVYEIYGANDGLGRGTSTNLDIEDLDMNTGGHHA